MPRQRLFDGSDCLVNFRIAEVGREAASAAIGGGSCSSSQRCPAEKTANLPACHCAVAYPAQSLVLKFQFVGPIICE